MIMEEISRKDLLDLLTKDRNYHFEHPNHVNNRVIYSLGGTLTTITVGLLIKSGDKQFAFQFLGDNLAWIVLIGVGYLFITWGLIEHTTMHFQQRKVLQKAIHFLIEKEHLDYKEFLNKFSENHLLYFGKSKLKVATKLFDIEPDNRKFLSYHDRKIELGISIVLVGVISILYALIRY